MRRKPIKELFLFLPAAAAFVLLIVCGEKTSAAAQSGLELCLHSVVPALFPFLVLTHLLLQLSIPSILLKSLGRGFEAVFGIRQTALPAFLAGLIGGYPLGADAAAESCRLGLCSEEEAGRLLIFANNCSPAFIFGLLGGKLPGGGQQAMILLGLQWFVSILLGVVLGIGHQPSEGKSLQTEGSKNSFFVRFTSSVKSGGRSVLNICAYVIYFSVFSAVLPASPLLRGMMELTGGILLLQPGRWSAVIAGFLIGFGGLSVACQVFSTLDGSGIQAGKYLPFRLLHGLLTAFGMMLLNFGHFYLLIYCVFLLGIAVFAKSCGNRSLSDI